jgi:hypothetical protein
MQQLTRTATFTDDRIDDEALTTIVARSVLEAALAEDEKAQLWFELAGGDDETRRLAIDLSAADLEEILRLSGDADVALTLDGEDVAGLFGDEEVEAHGMRAAIAIAVTSAAILAPAGHAATTQSIGTAATTQQASVAATAQVGTQATTQVGTEATTQVANAAVTAQVAGVQAKLATSKTAHLKAYKILRYGLVR